jgi:hypothetical protein
LKNGTVEEKMVIHHSIFDIEFWFWLVQVMFRLLTY